MDRDQARHTCRARPAGRSDRRPLARAGRLLAGERAKSFAGFLDTYKPVQFCPLLTLLGFLLAAPTQGKDNGVRQKANRTPFPPVDGPDDRSRRTKTAGNGNAAAPQVIWLCYPHKREIVPLPLTRMILRSN